LNGFTLEHVYIDKPPRLRHLKVFDYLAYIHVPKDKSKKLGLKSKWGILIGYDNASKAYNIYSPQLQKNVVTKDVVYDESITWTPYMKGKNTY